MLGIRGRECYRFRFFLGIFAFCADCAEDLRIRYGLW